MLAVPFSAFVNHLLAPAQWARESLAEHAGKIAVFDLFPLRIAVAVDPDGTLRAAPEHAVPAVTIRLTHATVLQILANGEEAWRTIEGSDVALVVCDVEMPRLDGVALCQRVRGSPRTASLPVILVTSLDEPVQRARGLEAGADAYITKSSFDQDTLLDTVRMLIGRNPGGMQ